MRNVYFHVFSISKASHKHFFLNRQELFTDVALNPNKLPGFCQHDFDTDVIPASNCVLSTAHNALRLLITGPRSQRPLPHGSLN